MEDESGVTRGIIDELHFLDIQGDQMAGGSGFTRSIIDELHPLDSQGDQMEGESMVLLEETVMNFILLRSKEFKWKVKVVFLAVSLMIFILGLSKKMK